MRENARRNSQLPSLQGKWKTRILSQLQHGPTRLSQLRRMFPEASKKMLTQHLRKLDGNGLVVRIDLSGRLRRVASRLLPGWPSAPGLRSRRWEPLRRARAKPSTACLRFRALMRTGCREGRVLFAFYLGTGFAASCAPFQNMKKGRTGIRPFRRRKHSDYYR